MACQVYSKSLPRAALRYIVSVHMLRRSLVWRISAERSWPYLRHSRCASDWDMPFTIQE
jgi:hypothetical protein